MGQREVSTESVGHVQGHAFYNLGPRHVGMVVTGLLHNAKDIGPNAIAHGIDLFARGGSRLGRHARSVLPQSRQVSIHKKLGHAPERRSK